MLVRACDVVMKKGLSVNPKLSMPIAVGRDDGGTSASGIREVNGRQGSAAQCYLLRQ